jgi:hypothetical protein
MTGTLKLLVILAIAGILGTLTILHTPGLNGPWYWRWAWVRLDGWRVFPAMSLAAGPFFLAQWVYARDRKRAVFAVTLLMLSTLSLELTAAGLHRRPFDVASIGDAIRDPVATSYFSDARDLLREGPSLREWLGRHADRMPRLRTHTRFKPPGLLLYHMAFIVLFGANSLAALTAGLLLAVLATLSVAGTYVLILKLCDDSDAAFCGAAFFSLCPSLVLFVPQFDQVYPAVACALVGLWVATLAQGRTILAVGFGFLLAVACFCSQMFLILGLVLAGLSALHIAKEGPGSLGSVARCAFLAILTVALSYATLWIISGYDPIATYRTASRLLAGYSVRAQRPYPTHVVFDALDFALGSGWISFVLAAFFIGDCSRVPRSSRHVAFLALGQILLTAVLGIVPAETARTWTLMLPLLMIPVGLELSGWTPWMRVTAYGGLWFVLVSIAQNMKFVITAKV